MKYDFNNLIYTFILCIYEYFIQTITEMFTIKKLKNIISIYKWSKINFTEYFTKIEILLFKHLGQICLGRAK